MKQIVVETTRKNLFLHFKLYFVSVVDASFGRTETVIKSVSTPIFGKINFWFGTLDEYVKVCVNNVPSKTSTSLNSAIPLKTGTVISLKIEKTKDWPPKALDDAATGPFLRVNVAGEGVIPLVFTKNDTVALAACLGRGT